MLKYRGHWKLRTFIGHCKIKTSNIIHNEVNFEIPQNFRGTVTSLPWVVNSFKKIYVWISRGLRFKKIKGYEALSY